MLLLVISAAILTAAPTIATPDDLYEDEPLYFMEARSPRTRQSEGGNSDAFLRFGRNSDVFMPFNDPYDIMDARPTRAQEKNDNFVRFGRSRSDFVRFGRNRLEREGIEPRVLRVGRSASEASDPPNRRIRRDVYAQSEKKDNRDNFMRFGRGRDDSFMRLGRDSVEEEKSKESVAGMKQDGNAHFMVNGRILRHSLLELLRKLEEAQRN